VREGKGGKVETKNPISREGMCVIVNISELDKWFNSRKILSSTILGREHKVTERRELRDWRPNILGGEGGFRKCGMRKQMNDWKKEENREGQCRHNRIFPTERGWGGQTVSDEEVVRTRHRGKFGKYKRRRVNTQSGEMRDCTLDERGRAKVIGVGGKKSN